MQEMFEKIDKEEDGEVYLREVVDYLDALDNNIEQSHKVILLNFIRRHGDTPQTEQYQCRDSHAATSITNI